MNKFIPDSFKPPVKFKLKNFTLEELKFKDAKIDYETFYPNRELIRKTRGGE